MSYDIKLADKIRERLTSLSDLEVQEKKMFGGLAFMVNGKMCINNSGDGLMCRHDPLHEVEVSQKKGYEPMIMKGKVLKGYCYVKPEGSSKKIWTTGLIYRALLMEKLKLLK